MLLPPIQDAPVERSLNEEVRQEITDQAIIFQKSTNRPLSDFQLHVNEAAIELALAQPSLVRKRGELLEMARKKVADDGYCFKKGESRSKVYGSGDAEPTVPKRLKLDQNIREERVKELEEDIAEISSHISFKEKRRTQAEIARNYKLCDDLTQEILECKGKKRELEKQLKLLLQKDRRSRKRKDRLKQISESRSRSTTPFTSRSTTPLPVTNRSTTPLPATSPLTPCSPSSLRSPLSPPWVVSSDKEDFHAQQFSPPSSSAILIRSSSGQSSGNPTLENISTSASDMESESHF